MICLIVFSGLRGLGNGFKNEDSKKISQDINDTSCNHSNLLHSPSLSNLVSIPCLDYITMRSSDSHEIEALSKQ